MHFSELLDAWNDNIFLSFICQYSKVYLTGFFRLAFLMPHLQENKEEFWAQIILSAMQGSKEFFFYEESYINKIICKK